MTACVRCWKIVRDFSDFADSTVSVGDRTAHTACELRYLRSENARLRGKLERARERLRYVSNHATSNCEHVDGVCMGILEDISERALAESDPEAE